MKSSAPEQLGQRLTNQLSQHPATASLWSPAVIILVVINSILAVVLVAVMVLNAQYTGSGDDGSPSAGSTRTALDQVNPGGGAPVTPTVPGGGSSPVDDSMSDETTQAPPSATAVTFALPSGNIWCSLDDQVLCTIAQVTDDAQWRDCNQSGYQVRLLLEGDAAVACPQENQPATAPSTYQEVKYGASLSNELFTCDVAESGVLCRAIEAGPGFSLNRAGWQER